VLGRTARLSLAPVLFAVLALASMCAPAEGAFPGANGKIAFVSDRANPCFGPDSVPTCNTDIYTADPDGTNITRLTRDDTLGMDDLYPAWSPDGKKIAFVSYRDADGCCEIFTMNADGSGLAQVTHTQGVINWRPAWSPDGTQLAVIRGDGSLFKMNVDGTSEVELLHDAAGVSFPDWSPDGSKILFGQSSLYTIHPDGTGLTFLNSTGSQGLDWSPDGSRIVHDLRSQGDLYILSSDGSTRQPLVSTPDIEEFWPAWSPDGTQIVFERSSIAGPVGIGVRSAVGGPETVIVEGGSQPDWQPVARAVPSRSEYKNASAYCKGLRDFLGDAEFGKRYRNHGKCVSSST
jgi:Tol biopolymer transport system component